MEGLSPVNSLTKNKELVREEVNFEIKRLMKDKGSFDPITGRHIAGPAK
jgi:hypothetical protein